jgi:nitrate reductase gamma subunit
VSGETLVKRSILLVGTGLVGILCGAVTTFVVEAWLQDFGYAPIFIGVEALCGLGVGLLAGCAGIAWGRAQLNPTWLASASATTLVWALVWAAVARGAWRG